MAIESINKTATQSIDENIIVMQLAASFNISAYFLSLIGSINAAVILTDSIMVPTLIQGIIQITSKETIPAVPTAFFISFVPLKTVSMLSDKKFPTTGMMLPTANFAVFIPRLSKDGAQNP